MAEAVSGRAWSLDPNILEKNFASLTVRDDLDFLDGSHLADDGVLVFDPANWQYSCVGRLDYEMFSAIDDAGTPQEAVGLIFERFGLKIDLERLLQVVRIAADHKFLDLWCYTPGILLPRSAAKNIAAQVATAITSSDKVFGRERVDWTGVQAALRVGDAVLVSRALQALFATAARKLAKMFYQQVVQATVRRKVKELGFVVSKIELFDPTPLLRAINPLLGWIHGPGYIVAFLGLSIFALQTPVEKLQLLWNLNSPGSSLIWTASFAPVLFVAGVFMLLAHELLGHALAMVRFGGRVPAIGVMLIFYMFPGAFANVSDSYRLPKAWQRVEIAAAGIMVNLLLALLAAGCFRFVDNGTLAFQFLAASFVVNLGVVLTNFIPWIKLDGYYILTDLIRAPNLDDMLNNMARAFNRWMIWGEPLSACRTAAAAHLRLLAPIAVVRFVWFTFVVAWFALAAVPRFASAAGLAGVAFFFYMVVGSRLVVLASKARPAAYFQAARKLAKVWLGNPLRLTIAAGIAYLLFVHPFGWTLDVPALLEPIRQATLVAPADALVRFAPPRHDHAYQANDTIFRLESPELEGQLATALLGLEQKRLQADVTLAGATQQERQRAQARVTTARVEAAVASTRMDEQRTARNFVTDKDRARLQASLERSQQSVNDAERAGLATLQGPRQEIQAAALAQVEELEALVERLRAARAELAIVAPFSGTVLVARDLAVGSWVAKGQVLANIMALDRLRPIAYLSSLQPIHLVDTHQAARLFPPQLEGPPINLSVREVRANESEIYRVELEPVSAGAEVPVRAGMSATVRLPLIRSTVAVYVWRTFISPSAQALRDLWR